MTEPVLALLDTNGIYIPQLYCNNIDQSIADEMHISMEDVRICQAGPDHERYGQFVQIDTRMDANGDYRIELLDHTGDFVAGLQSAADTEMNLGE